MDDKSFNIRVPKKWARMGMVALVTALIVAPLTAIAAHTFTDVPDTNTFHEDIAWLKDAGVTLGCNPPANTEFCPKDEVTREQMSAFMRRLAENKVVDAATAVQADSATTAGNADTVDGFDAADLVSNGQLVSDQSFVDLPGDATTQVASLELTPGSYVLMANGMLNSNTIGDSQASCTLAADGTSVETGAFFLGDPPDDREGFALGLTTTVAGTTSATLSCDTPVGWSGNIYGPTITAISVGSESASITASGLGGDGEG